MDSHRAGRHEDGEGLQEEYPYWLEAVLPGVRQELQEVYCCVSGQTDVVRAGHSLEIVALTLQNHPHLVETDTVDTHGAAASTFFKILASN